MLFSLTAKQIKSVVNHHFCRLSNLNIVLNHSTCSIEVVPKSNLRSFGSATKSPKPNKYTVFCNTLITKHGRAGNLGEAEAVFNRMSFKNVVSWTAMLTAYADNGQTAQARMLFDEMPDRSTASWNAMITAYIRDNVSIGEAKALFDMIPEPNSVSYAAMITGYVKAGMFDRAEKLYSEAPLNWRDPICSNALISGYLNVGDLGEAIRIFNGMVEKDVISWSSMVDGYCKKGMAADARELFEKMPKRNVVTWTAMVDGYMKMGYFEDGFNLFLRLRREAESVKVNPTTLSAMVEACGSFGRFGEGIQIHGLVLTLGYEFNVFLGNSVISMYCRFGNMKEANTAFNCMIKKDVVSWNSLIAGFVDSGDIGQANTYFEKMPCKDVVSWTTMITAFSSEGCMEKSVTLFEMMPMKDNFAGTAVISGYVNNGECEQAIHWYTQMVHKGIRPNSFTLSTLLSASSCLASLNQGLQFHALALKMDMELDLSIQNSLVSMYSKCGNISDAKKIFKSINSRNLISYNSMITGFAQNGFAEEALQLFEEMRNENVYPNQITFLGVLSACTHMGLVKEGRYYFKSMKFLYNIEPVDDHYACMVDLLGRSGFLDEAIDLIHSMPFEPHSGIWGALLGASRIHQKLDLAKLAAEHLYPLEPLNATPYVVLSSLYSTFGRGEAGEKVRISKKQKGIRKNPGCSWILVKNKVRLFLAGDQSLMGSEEIKAILLLIAEEIR